MFLYLVGLNLYYYTHTGGTFKTGGGKVSYINR